MKKPTLKNLQTIFKSLAKNVKYPPIFQYVKVSNGGIFCTDLETNLVINDAYGLEDGAHNIDTLGLVGPSKAIDLSEYPNFPVNHVVNPERVIVNAENLFFTNKFSSDDETRLYLKSVCFDSGHYVATNGHVMHFFETSEKLKKQYLVSSESLKVLEKMLKFYGLNKSQVTFSFDDSHVYFSCKFFDFSARLISGEYLKWQTILPKKYSHKIELKNVPALKEYKAILSRSKTVRFDCTAGKITMEIVNPELEEKKIFEVGTCDPKLGESIGFNAEYLSLASNGLKDFSIEFNGPLHAAKINQSIVMPIKL